MAASEIADYYPQSMTDFLGDPSAIRATACRTSTGRAKRDRIRKIVNWLMYEKSFRYQSLVGNSALSTFRANGSLQLSNYLSLGTASTYPQEIKYPIYIFRCGVPNGLQVDFPTASTAVDCRPLIGYRLTSSRASAGTPNIYKWETISPSQNCNMLAAPSTFTNIQGVVSQDDSNPFEAMKVRHDYSSCSVFYSAPSDIESTLVCGYVKFSRDDFCPPDEYVNASSVPPYNTVEAIRANSGAYNIAAATKPIPDQDAIQHMTDFYDQYITNREGHPLRRYIGNDNQVRSVFSFVGKQHVKVFTPVSTETKNGFAYTNQHQHTDLMRSMGWMDTSISTKLAQLKPLNTQNDPLDAAALTSNNTFAGIFPAPTRQRWFMVQGFVRSGTLETLPPPPTDRAGLPSFDFSMQQKFSVFTDPARRIT